jgi:hypothetical protein
MATRSVRVACWRSDMCWRTSRASTARQ